MPIYEYKCPECDYRFDMLRKIADRKDAPCPECEKTALQQVTFAHFDPKMGCDPDFPTFAAKWDKKHRKLQTGKMKDSNNNQLHNDPGHDARDAQKRGV